MTVCDVDTMRAIHSCGNDMNDCAEIEDRFLVEGWHIETYLNDLLMYVVTYRHPSHPDRTFIGTGESRTEASMNAAKAAIRAHGLEG